MTLKTLPFDAADAFDTPQSQAELLAEALESGQMESVIAALNIITRAKGMTSMAKETGLSREALYRATGPQGNPTLSTLMAIVKSAGLKLSAAT